MEVKRSALLLYILKMAEGELNVDSLISRLLEGEPILPGLSLLIKVAFWAHFERRYDSLTTAVVPEREVDSRSGYR